MQPLWSQRSSRSGSPGTSRAPSAVGSGKGRPLADYTLMSAGDLKAAIEIYLRQDARLEHVAVLLPPPSSPGTTQDYVNLLDADYQLMVRALGDSRVTVAYGPAISVSNPDGAFTWTLPCTRQEKLASESASAQVG